MRKDVLILEDEPVLRKHLARKLTRVGYRVRSAESIGDFVSMIRAGVRPGSVLIVDVNLPDGDGIAALKVLLPKIRAAKGIVMTAGSLQDAEERAAAAGAHHALPKPLDIPRLLKAIEVPAASVTCCHPGAASTSCSGTRP